VLLLLAPLAVATVVGTAAVILGKWVRPSLLSRLLVSIALAVSGCAVLVVTSLATIVVLTLPLLSDALGWCNHLESHHHLPAWGKGAVLLSVLAMAGAFARVLRQRAPRLPSTEDELVVLRTEQPHAFAVPGSPGHIVISTGLLHQLHPEERRAVLAHERAHLRCRHHRYTQLSRAAASLFPFLLPIDRAVRLGTERWADEEAAREVGDRSVVARAIARAALAGQNAPAPALNSAGSDVGKRVESLLARPPRWNRVSSAVLPLVALGLVVVTSMVVQIQQLAVLAEHLCRWS